MKQTSNPNGITKQPCKSRAVVFMPCTYIIYSAKLDKYYIGACVDFERRLREHNTGHSTFTSTGMPWERKFIKEFPTLQEAKAFELKLKKMKSRKYIEELIAVG